MFSRSKMHDTKKLLEGDGMGIRIKFEHNFTGFIGAYTLITTNSLPYPFVRPESSSAGFREDEWKFDKGALEVRTTIIKMEKSYAEEDDFPFTQDEFANMMLSMYVYEEDYVEYKAPYDVDELTPQKTTQDPRDLNEAKS